MSDSFMWIDRKYKVTQELLKILRHYKYPYIVFTRSDLIATDEYMSLMDQNLVSVQFSMCGGNEALTRKIEPGAPGVQRRLEALKVLSENGFWTTVRVNPLFPIYPDGYFYG
jgi:DNA repair photolyase